MTKQHSQFVPTSRERDCVPCDLPPFGRNNFFTGKLMTARDFTDEQHYVIDKLRLHHLALHGWGVVCGLKVKLYPHCPSLRILVEPGLAIDDCGHEIRVLREVELELPKPSQRPGTNHTPCPPEHGQVSQDQSRQQSVGQQHQGPSAQWSPEVGGAPEHCPPTTSLYICLRYVECETEFMPAPFDECACNESTHKPNRIHETYKLEVLTEEPPGLEQFKKMNAECATGDCKALYETMLKSCPEPGGLDCIPLAVIRNYTPGQAVTEDMIDNWEYRPLLPSTRLLDQLIRCILDKLPTKVLTCIQDIGWTHDREYHCHDFMRLFVGDDQYPKAFEITFEKPVRTEGLSPRSFQAVVVRHSDKANEGGYLEVVPAKVWASEDRTRFFLRIDPAYAEHCLHGTSFDLYLTLRCDVMVDERGIPVDGNFLAKLQTSDQTYQATPPTGDGIPGGTFESWIRVRR